MNAGTGSLLYQKNRTEKVAPASTAICVVMGSTEAARFQDSLTIYDKIKK